MPRKTEVHWHKGAKRWYASIGNVGANGRRKEVYAPPGIGPKDREGAWDWLKAERAKRLAAETPVAPDLITVTTLVELYLKHAETARDEGRLSAAHFRSKTHHVGHLAVALGNRMARTLTPGDMERFVLAMQRTYAPNYVANICSTVSAAFRWGVRAKHLAANPIEGFETPMIPRSPERFADRKEIAAFLAHWRTRTDRKTARGRYDRLTLLLVRCLVRTGARPGELCKLWWADIQWAGGKSSAGHGFAKAVIPFDRWKSGHATGKPRTIYFSPALTRALRREHDRPGRHPVSVFVHGRGRGGVGAGEPWLDGSTLSKTVMKVRREAIARGEALKAKREPLRGLDLIRDDGHNRLTNYRFRHTGISTLLMMGVDVSTIGDLTGTSPEMIYRNYGHLLDRHLQQAAEKLYGRATR